MSKCTKCGRSLLVVKEAVIGFPGYYVRGTRIEYCSVCEVPPEVTLDNTKSGSVVLVLDEDP